MTTEEKNAMVMTAGKRLADALGRGLTVQWPTPGDLFVIEEHMLALAQKSCVNPLAAVAAVPASALSGADREAALALALQHAAGGGVAPSNLAVVRAYNSVEGLRYRLFRLTRRTHPELGQADIDPLVTEANRPDLIDALDGLLRVLDPGKDRPATGT